MVEDFLSQKFICGEFVAEQLFLIMNFNFITK